MRSTVFWPHSEQARRQVGERSLWQINLAAVAAPAALVVCALLIFMPGRHSPDPISIRQISAWRAPSDALLRTPGSEIFSTMPRFGELPDGQTFYGRTKAR